MMSRARRAGTLSFAVAVLLGAAACARMQSPVSLPSLALGEPSFYPTLEAYAAAPIVGGNRVALLLNGEQSFPSQLDAIAAARRSVTFAQYYYEEGPVARLLAEALADRCRAGVKGHVLLDGFGSLAMPAPYIDTMKAAGCEVVFFRPLGPRSVYHANNRNHRRILVVDGRMGFTGGSGVSRKWMGNGRVADHWRDTDVTVEGPVVQYLQGAFVENWLEATGVILGGDDYFPRPLPTPGQVYAQVVRSSPANGGHAMYTTLLLAMASARRSIVITTPYFLPDAKMREALTAAARRGARVEVLVPGVVDHNLVRWASRRQFGPLLRAGVVIHEYQKALLHAKTMVVDGVWATVGSANLDNRSFALNDELNLVVYDRAFAGRLEAAFADDLAYSTPVTYDGWRRRGFRERVLELFAIPFHDNL